MKHKPLRYNTCVFSVKPVWLLLVFVVLSPLVKTQSLTLNSMITRVVVDSLVQQVNKFYVSKEAALKITTYLKQRYDQGVYNKTENPFELAGIINKDVYSVHRDEHFHMEYNPVLAAESAGEIEDVPKMVAQKMEEEKDRNYGFKKVEILPGNIGLLEISSFARLNKYSKAAANAAFLMLANSKALVIDLRYGRGGSPDMVNYIASYFLKNKTHIADIYIRSENLTLPYYTTSDTTFKAFATKPVYILTSYRTFSAAEGLAYCLQSQKRGIIVGEKTRGGAHTVTYKPLSSGFVCDIPFGRVTDPISKRNWEGVGVTPDIATDSENALETAILKIFGNRMASTRDSSALNLLTWQLKLIRSYHHPYSADTATLLKYTGSYGTSTVGFNKGTLYFQKTGLPLYKLVALNDTFYRPHGNDGFLLEFKISNSKKEMVIWYEDGRTERIEMKH